jgi:hypothetical protein
VLIPVSLRPLEAFGPAISSERTSLWEVWILPETISVFDRKVYWEFHIRQRRRFDVHEYANRNNL